MEDAKVDLFHRAEEAFSVASDLFDLGHYRDAMSKVYYSMFYATEAVLLTEGQKSSSHRGVIHLFIENFVKTGKFKHDYSKLLTSSFQNRMAADYEIDFEMSKEEISVYLQKGREYLDAVKDFLGL